jgi:dUTP pyrophosphatase
MVQDGARIAQLIIAKYEPISWQVVSVLDETARGEAGHGSTGQI